MVGRRLCDRSRDAIAVRVAVHIHLKTFARVAVPLGWLLKPGSLRRISDPPRQHEHDNDDQNGADDADTTVSVAISAEAATEAPKQENEQDNNENEPKRHGRFS